MKTKAEKIYVNIVLQGGKRYVVEKHPTDDKWCIHDTSKGQFGYTSRYYTFENEAIEDCKRLNAESETTE